MSPASPAKVPTKRAWRRIGDAFNLLRSHDAGLWCQCTECDERRTFLRGLHQLPDDSTIAAASSAAAKQAKRAEQAHAAEQAASAKRCAACGKPARPLGLVGPFNPFAPIFLCGKRGCAETVAADLKKQAERQAHQDRAREQAADAAARDARREAERDATGDLFLSLVNGATAPLALGQGDVHGRPHGEDHGEALVLVTDASALAHLPLNPPTAAEERSRRRRVLEEARAARRALDARLDALVIALQPVQEHLERVHEQQRAIEARATRVISGVRATPNWTPEDIAELERLAAEAEPLRIALAERDALEHELELAAEAQSRASHGYTRWLRLEQARRRDLLQERDTHGEITAACARCGHAVSFWDGKDFCGDDCKTHYEPFYGKWFARCDICRRFFAADAHGATGDIPVIDETTLCSWTCLLLSDFDLDDWPPATAPCLTDVHHMPHPPLTGHQRAAAVRRQVLARLARRGRPATAPAVVLATTPPPKKSAASRILEALERAAGPLTQLELVKASGLGRTRTLDELRALVKAGALVVTGLGFKGSALVYTLPPGRV